MVLFHTIPDIELINQNVAENSGSFWTKLSSEKNDYSKATDDNINVDLPKLKGVSSCISFRDAPHPSWIFIVISGRYNRKSRRHVNSALLEVSAINLEEENVFETQPIHFGLDYCSDN